MLLEKLQHLLRFAKALFPEPAFILGLSFSSIAAIHAQTNDWIAPRSGDWDLAPNWSLGLPNSDQSEVRIANPGSKAVAIQPNTPVNSPLSMTVQNLRTGGVAPDTNLLLLNFFGTTKPLRVLNDFVVETHSGVLMLFSGLDVSNVLTVRGTIDQESGLLTFTNSPASTMQIDGGRFNMTNGVVSGDNLFLGGTNDSHVNQDGGIVSVSRLTLGNTATYPFASNATYQLQNGWVLADTQEVIGQTDLGRFVQSGGTNSTPDLLVGNGVYIKNRGSLFAGQMVIDAPLVSIFAPPSAIVNHAGGTAIITNFLRMVGESSRLGPRAATFTMSGGTLSTPLIQLQMAAEFHQTGGIVNVADMVAVNDFGARVPSNYYLSAGTLFTPRTTLVSSYPNADGFIQSGGVHMISDTLSLNGSAMYHMRGGLLSAPNLVFSGSPGFYQAQLFVLGSPAFTITNENISLQHGSVIIGDSAQQFGRLTVKADSGIHLSQDFAVLRFADSHTNSWQSETQGVIPTLNVYNWDGSTNGGGTDQLVFGSNSSALTATQLRQIRFINPSNFPSGAHPALILPTGEVVPQPAPVLVFQFEESNLAISWSGDFTLQSATNVAGPYSDVTNASNPFTGEVDDLPMQFFRLRN